MIGDPSTPSRPVNGQCPVFDGKVQVKVPAAQQTGVSVFEVAVQAQGGAVRVDRRQFVAVASSTISVDTPTGQEQPDPDPGPANQAPVARFFAVVDPVLRLDARSRRTRSPRVGISLKTGRPKGLPKACRALTRHLTAR